MMWKAISSIAQLQSPSSSRSSLDMDKDPAEHIADSILSEVEYEMRHRAIEERRRLLEEPVGYEWLVEPENSSEGVFPEISAMDKLVIHNMASRVPASQCASVIHLFRLKCDRQSCSHGGVRIVPNLMKEAILEGNIDVAPRPRPRRPATSLSLGLLKRNNRPLSTRSAKIFPQHRSDSILTLSSRIDDLPV